MSPKNIWYRMDIEFVKGVVDDSEGIGACIAGVIVGKPKSCIGCLRWKTSQRDVGEPRKCINRSQRDFEVVFSRPFEIWFSRRERKGRRGKVGKRGKSRAISGRKCGETEGIMREAHVAMPSCVGDTSPVRILSKRPSRLTDSSSVILSTSAMNIPK